MPDPLERVLTHFRRPPERNGHAPARLTAAAFRASVELRLANLERELADLKGRLNGLIFLVIGTVITQVLLRLMA
jgi:hypothetical protein